MWNYSNYGNDLNITKNDAASCSHSGECENDVKYLMQSPKVKKQLDRLNPEQLKKELSDYGAWDDEQLQDHQDNLMRWLWISCCDITERN